MINQNKTVLVGMSGGVDSSTAALLLREQGYTVIGATMSIWGKDGVYKQIQDKLSKLPTKKTHGACLGPDEKEDIESARKVCSELGIEFHVFDCAKQYEEIVLTNFKKEYLQGRTPNPCIWCNSLIKFDVLPKLAKINGIDFDYFATGHYASIVVDNGKFLLKRGINKTKDQSYFLYRLTQEQLSKIKLPLGSYSKEEIREIAKNYGLTVADKPDSQDFYEGDYNELLQVQDKTGNIVDTQGKILGTHKGIWNYTIGQRKGLGVSSTEPLYVIDLDKDKNEVIVGVKEDTFSDSLIATKLNWISGEVSAQEFTCKAKIRSTQQPTDVVVRKTDENYIEVKFADMQKSITPGQSIVLYDDDIVLGGGIIDKVN